MTQSRRPSVMRRLVPLVTLIGALFAADATFAQGVQTGTIRGTVKDQQGLVMPGVTVTVTSAALQGQRTVVTGTDGNFTVQFLPAGTYEARYELQGFSPVVQT